MDDVGDLPKDIKQIHHALKPYIRQRQDALHVRHVLAAHLNSHVKAGEGSLVPTNLSLVDPACEVAEGDGFPGVRREYLRCLRANLEARKEFATISTQYQDPNYRSDIWAQDDKTTSAETSLNSFLDLERQRQRHERFRIIQDLVDQLVQKPAAASDHLDPRKSEVFRDVGVLPQVPPVVLAPTKIPSERIDLIILVDQLEKSVLRAKLLLKKEQKLLAKVRAGATSTDQGEQGSRQQALGTTRNELINWIELELGKAGESSAASEGESSSISENRAKDYLGSQLSSIKRIYEQYLEIRKRLIVAATGELPPPPTELEINDPPGTPMDEHSNDIYNITGFAAYSHLEELVSVSHEQKSVLQQRSYLTSSLTRQLKDAGQDLNRLADESHLLPSYPMPATTSQRKGLGDAISFEDEISNSDKPSSSGRARAWVFAAESSSIATKEAVLERLEDGESALADAHQTLLDLQVLLGCPSERQNVQQQGPIGTQILENIGGMWSILDGNLGVIRPEEQNADQI